jgi:hypothetical protein
MLFPKHVIDSIVDCATWADRLCRADLIHGAIATENDYTSNLTAAFRREIVARHIPGLTATAHLLTTSLERKFGTDACFVLMNDTEFKICLFEAKWPRLQTRTNCWDSLLKSGQSRFHSQLLRQNPFAQQFAIWEMFYCEFPYFTQPGFMPDEVSACVWHDPAHAVTQARPSKTVPWTDTELTGLLSSNLIEIGDAIRAACECSIGLAIPGHSYLSALSDIGVPQNLTVIAYQPNQASRLGRRDD